MHASHVAIERIDAKLLKDFLIGKLLDDRPHACGPSVDCRQILGEANGDLVAKSSSKQLSLPDDVRSVDRLHGVGVVVAIFVENSRYRPFRKQRPDGRHYGRLAKNSVQPAEPGSLRLQTLPGLLDDEGRPPLRFDPQHDV